MSPIADHPAATREPIALVSSLEHGQAPAEHSPQWLPQEDQHAHDQHAEPEMPLVIEREIAIAEMPVGRQIEEQQPADAGHQHETRVAQSRRHRLGSGLKSLSEPARQQEHEDGGAEQPQDERRRRRGPAGAFAAGHERAFDRQRPRHAAEPRGDRPGGERQGDANRGRERSAGKLNQPEAGQHPAGPLPAGGMQQAAHRVVLGCGARRLTRLGHQRRCLRERLGQAERAAPALGGSGFDRQQCDVGQRRRRGMPIDRRGKQQQRVRARRIAVGRRGGGRLARERALDPFEGAFQGHRARAVRPVEHIPIDEGQELRLRGFDGIAQHEQIAQTFALLQPKLRQARLRVPERREKRGSSPGASVGQRQRQPGEVASGFAVAAPAEPLAHDRLRESAVRHAKRAAARGSASRGPRRSLRRNAGRDRHRQR